MGADDATLSHVEMEVNCGVCARVFFNGSAGTHLWAWSIGEAWEVARPDAIAGGDPPVFTYSSAGVRENNAGGAIKRYHGPGASPALGTRPNS